MKLAAARDNLKYSDARSDGPSQQLMHAGSGACPRHTTRNLPAVNPVEMWGRSGRAESVGQKKGTKSAFYTRYRKARKPSGRGVLISSLLADANLLRASARQPLIQIRTGTWGEQVDSHQLVDQCVHDLLELRRPAPYKGSSTVSGLFAFSSELGSYRVWFESKMEKEWLQDLVWREQPRFISTQSISLAWEIDGHIIEHVVDGVIETPDGRRIAFDAHDLYSDGEEDENFLVKARLTSLFFDTIGWEYRIGGPLPRQYIRNLDTMDRYAKVCTRIKSLSFDIIQDAGLPRSVAGITSWAASNGTDSSDALAAIFHLTRWQKAWLCLHNQVYGRSPVRAAPTWDDLQSGWRRPVWGS